jgi:hypothetical protein
MEVSFEFAVDVTFLVHAKALVLYGGFDAFISPMRLWRVLMMLLINALALYDGLYHFARHCRSLMWRP